MNPADVLIDGGIAGTLLLGAAVDLRTRRVPIAVTLGSAVAGLVANLVLHQGLGAVRSADGWLVGIGILLLPFIARGVGSSNVKLLAAIGAWNGPGFVVQRLFWAALAASGIALAILIVRGQLVGALRAGLARVAYVVAMAIALLVPPLTGIVQSRLGAIARDDGAATGRRLIIPFGPALALGGGVALTLATY
jgi:prepilin peptidase CpaA